MTSCNSLTIIDIYWHNIYLTLKLNVANLEAYNFYLSDLKENVISLPTKEDSITLNIVNLPEIKVLGNGKWHFLYELKETKGYHFLEISAKCGYKIEDLDKIYRYGAQKYAYIIDFEIQDYQHKLEDIKSVEIRNKFVEAHEAHEKMILQMFTTYMMSNKREDKRNIFIESNSIHQFIKKGVFIIVKKMIQLLYQLLTFIRRKDGNHILFMSETRVPIGGNLKALDERMKDRGLDSEYTLSYSFSKTLQQSKFKTLFTWSRLLWLIAKQDVIFVDDYVPIFKTIRLCNKTKLIQLWHAGVGFKSVGYSRFGRAGSPHPTDSCHRQYDYAVVGARGLIPVYEEVFGIDETQFLPYGLPRLDGYMDKEKITAYQAQFYQDHPSFKGKKVIMFAPTYRGNTQKEAYYPMDMIDQKKLYDVCGEQYIFLYKMHPFILDEVDIPEAYRDRLYDFSKMGDINELFYITDILITDFSSNIYEFALQRKPIIFYAYDKDFYQLTRGVHRTLDQAPGNVCETFDDVLNVIQNQSYEIEKLNEFIQESFVGGETTFASDQIIDNVLLKNRRNQK